MLIHPASQNEIHFNFIMLFTTESSHYGVHQIDQLVSYTSPWFAFPTLRFFGDQLCWAVPHDVGSKLFTRAHIREESNCYRLLRV